MMDEYDEIVEFDEELYKKNLEENDFSGSDEDGVGEENENNEG